jgi:hypothetical protein
MKGMSMKGGPGMAGIKGMKMKMDVGMKGAGAKGRAAAGN